VEISVDFTGGTMHMLAYFKDHNNKRMDEALARLRKGREERNVLILERLNTLGFSLAWEDVAKHAKQDVVGRPHFAQAMIEKGYVKKKEDAFDRFLAKGQPAYADRFRFGIDESLALIRDAGGVSVLAHPFTLNLGRRRLRAYVAELAKKGLQGIEAYYSEHDRDQQRFCLSLGRDLGLAICGGSDFHGAMNPHSQLGVGFGTLNVPDDLLDPLLARALHD